jgi:stage IV sporulation protein FB
MLSTSRFLGGPGVFLLEPQPTPYDLRFRIFGIPVRVHPMFWLMMTLFGWGAMQNGGIEYVLVFVVCAFVSVLLHELGHVWMGQLFGTHGHIVLYSFGGLAIGSNHLVSPWKRIAVSLAGPLSNFVQLGLAWLVLEYGNLPKPTLDGHVPLLWFAVRVSWWINLVWGLLNLVPVWPLDGGQVSRDFLTAVLPDIGLRLSLGISLVIAGLLAAHCIMNERGQPLLPFLPFGSVFSGIFFALMAFESYQLLQQTYAERRWHDEHWDRY